MLKLKLTSVLLVCLWAPLLLTAKSPDIVGAGEDDTIFCAQPTGTKVPKLPASFPDLFSVAIEAVYSGNDSKIRLSQLEQSYDKNNSLSAITRFEDGIRYQYIFNATSKNYSFVNDSTTCVDGLRFPFEASEGATNDPLQFPNNISGWNNISSIMDILSWWAPINATIYKDEEQKGRHEHGIPVEHYYVCKPKGPDGYAIEIEICLTKPEVKMPFPGVNGSLPVRIDIKKYSADGSNAGNVTVIKEFVGYQLSGYQLISEKERPDAFLPPPGVPCANVSSQSGREMPQLPTDFSVHIDYMDQEDRRMDSSQLHLDFDSHLLAFEYTNNDTDIPLAAHARLPNGRFEIVHDFKDGIEYIVNMNTGTCVSVSDIPTNATDAYYKTTEKKRVMALKNGTDLLGLTLDNATYYYVGERFLDDLMPADVWLAYEQANETSDKQWRVRTTVNEAYFSKLDWKIITANATPPQPVLLALKKYHWLQSQDGKKSPPATTVQRFYDFTPYTSRGPNLQLFDVSPCLNFSKNDSYLVAFANDTLVNLDSKGRGSVENATRSALANAAGVSPLRVTSFYFEPVNESCWVFFFIADRPSANGSETEWRQGSPITAKEARTNLNKTLTEKSLSVEVPLEDGTKYYLRFNQSSLSAVPPYFKPPVVVNVVTGASGYSGSSMAALGICMLLIGGVLGLVLAFFMWKRNRGIAYQIYE